MRAYSIKSLGMTIKRFLNKDWDFPLVITGDTGVGKSTLALSLALAIKPHFDMENCILFKRDKIIDKIMNLPNKSVIIADEAVNVAFTRDAMMTEQKEFIKLLDICRDKNHCLIMNIPFFWSLDTHIRNSKIKLWIYVDKRGKAFIFKRRKSPYIKDPWFIKDNEKILKNWERGINPYRSPNFIGAIKFTKLDNEIENRYKTVKAKAKGEIFDKKEKTYKDADIEKLKKEWENQIEARTLMKVKEMGGLKRGMVKDYAQVLGVSIQAFKNRANKAPEKTVVPNDLVTNELKSQTPIPPQNPNDEIQLYGKTYIIENIQTKDKKTAQEVIQ